MNIPPPGTRRQSRGPQPPLFDNDEPCSPSRGFRVLRIVALRGHYMFPSVRVLLAIDGSLWAGNAAYSCVLTSAFATAVFTAGRLGDFLLALHRTLLPASSRKQAELNREFLGRHRVERVPGVARS